MDGDISYSLAFIPRMMSHSYHLHFYFFIFCFGCLYMYCLYIKTFLCSLPAVMAPLCSDKEPHAVFYFPFRIILIKFAFV